MEKEVKRPQFVDGDFKKSSLSGIWVPGTGNCVEVAQRDGVVAVRNSKDPQKSMVFFTADEWNAFVGGVKQGEFDF